MSGAPAVVQWSQICPYCLREHDRPRAVYCDPEHARRAALERQRGRGKVRRTFAKVHARVTERGYRESAWRNVTAGRDRDRNIALIFGVTADTNCLAPVEWDSGE